MLDISRNFFIIIMVRERNKTEAVGKVGKVYCPAEQKRTTAEGEECIRGVILRYLR